VVPLKVPRRAVPEATYNAAPVPPVSTVFVWFGRLQNLRTYEIVRPHKYLSHKELALLVRYAKNSGNSVYSEMTSYSQKRYL